MHDFASQVGGYACTMADDEKLPLTDEELEANGELLPDREAMSLIAPGSTTGTPAAAMLPDESMQWHGRPDEPHIM